MGFRNHSSRGVALVALAWSGMAQAQVASSEPQARETAAKADDAGIADIIVTAERRSTSLQRVPQLIQAVSGDDLASANVNNASALQNIVPNLHIVDVGVQPSTFIRGVGSVVANVRGDPAASYSMDNIAIARPVSINGAFYDLDRVEVLKGPQGTLYGRNATVGAINVISRRPSFDEVKGYVSLEVGNYDLVRTEGAVNVPLAPTLAVRASFQSQKRDGYLTSGANDADSIAGRVSLLWEPSDVTTVYLFANYFKDTGVGIGDVPLKSATGSFLRPSNPWFVKTGTLNNNDTVPTDGRQHLRSVVVGGQIDVDLGGATATILPGYVRTNYRALTYSGGFRQHIETPDEQASVEARLSSKGDGPFTWIIGGLYLSDKQSGVVDLGSNLVSLSRTSYNKLDLESYAAFGQATFAVTPEFRLNGGIRYSHDKKSMDGYLQTVSLTYVPTGPQTRIFGEQIYENVSYKAGLEYDLAPSHLVYTNISTGYKAGGFNAGTPPNTYKPEELTAYTIGAKNSFNGRRVILNVEAWYWNYKNVNQFQFGSANPFPNIQLLTYNAAKLISKGVEVQSEFAIGSHGRFTAHVAYTDASFKSFSLPAFVFGPFNISASDFSGTDNLQAPHWSATLGYTHSWPLANGGTVVANASSQLNSSKRITVNEVPGNRVGRTTNSDISLSYTAPGDRFEIQGWIKNIENDPVLHFGGVTPAGLWGHPGAPRTFGVSGTVRF